jgi:16S rRNA (uracil1498-N3)-methyltransferase
MTVARFFVEGRHALGDAVTFDAADAHKIIAVLRKHDGDAVEVIDSAAQRFIAVLKIDGKSAAATLTQLRETEDAALPRITVAQGVPKGQKMDFVVEKLTELGVASIVPLQSERAVVSDVGTNKLERWRRLAKTAAQQCGRADIPPIEEPRTFTELLQLFKDYDAVLFPWELADRVALRERLPALVDGRERILVIIGPEGGFSHAEAQAAQEAGAQLISLGTRILRTETAALVLVSIIAYLMS